MGNDQRSGTMAVQRGSAVPVLASKRLKHLRKICVYSPPIFSFFFQYGEFLYEPRPRKEIKKKKRNLT
jgi:hypothetical protein